MLYTKVYAYARLNFHHDLLLDVLKKRITEAISPAQLLARVRFPCVRDRSSASQPYKP